MEAKPLCLCACGCGNPLPLKRKRATCYLWGHHPKEKHFSDESRKALSQATSDRLKNEWKNGKHRQRYEDPLKIRELGSKISAAQTGRRQPEGTIQKRQESLLSLGEDHPSAVKGAFRSPDNVIYPYTNVSKFVREHLHLFSEEDAAFLKKGGQFVCNAMKGLYSLRMKGTKPAGTWKGWTAVSDTEVFYNRGEHLLSVENP